MGGRGIDVPLDRGAAFLIASSFSTYSAAGVSVSASPIKKQEGGAISRHHSTVPSLLFVPNANGGFSFLKSVDNRQCKVPLWEQVKSFLRPNRIAKTSLTPGICAGLN